jgi:hypothetical protein
MTASLKKAFERAAALPDAAQEQLAAQLREDIEAELQWDRTLDRSQPLLEKLARRALAQKKARRTLKRGFDEL